MATKKKRSPEDYSIDELRRLMIEKRRAERDVRLAQYRRSGRSIQLEPAPSANHFDGDAPFADEEDEPVPSRRPRRRSILDSVLVVVEVLAVLGFIFIMVNVLGLLQNLNKEVAASILQPTLAPTPIFQAVVLPSGHTPPTDPGGVRFNESEIPEHLRAHVKAMANIPIPTPSAESAIRIRIPAISVDAPIVMGDFEEQLKKGVGQMLNTPNPGQNGNIVLSAHNDVFGEIFRYLDQLKNGDEVILYTNLRSYTYVVQQQQIVEPTQVEVLAQTNDPIVTLISCYPYMVDNQRIVITATLLKQ
jgi:sortase A